MKPNRSADAVGYPNLARWLCIVILLGLFGFQFSVAWRPIPVLLDQVVNDDTFYYLEVAQRAAQGQGFTFDGQNPTNGFQPAWGLILTGLAFIIRDKESFLRATLILCAALNLLSGIGLYRFWTRYWSVIWAPLALALWGSIQLNLSIALTGMETSLNIAIFVLLLWYTAQVVRAPAIPSLRNAAIIGALGGLLVMARIDNALFAAAFALAGGWPDNRADWRASLKFWGVTALVASAMIVPYLVWNLVDFGAWLPVSGLFKQRYNLELVVEPLGGYLHPAYLTHLVNRLGERLSWAWANTWAAFGAGVPLWLAWPLNELVVISTALVLAHLVGSGFAARFQAARTRGQTPPVQFTWVRPALGRAGLLLIPFWLSYGLAGRYLAGLGALSLVKGVVILAGLVGAGVWGWFAPVATLASRPARRREQVLVMALLLSLVAHGVAIILLADYFLNYTSWYLASWFVLFLLVSTWGLAKFGQAVFRGGASVVYERVMFSLALVGLVGTAYTTFTRLNTVQAAPYSQLVTAYYLARDIDLTQAPEVHLASANAGVLGYFSNRSTTNLDGLINNQSLMPYLFGPQTMTDYLDVICADYLIDHVEGDLPEGTLPEDAQILKIDRNRLKPVTWTATRGWQNEAQTFITFEIEKSAACS